ncbi:PoNe immunity protein domain-containing protein [Streptococcus loxodontisalivarius]|uniref:DUF1911 domain-containing protein n=1 Tax=Streptococcus loxodontisalivarius TaxID=1349415 RepID=A0ABS2PSV0_9STRE|nr:PoNe immunity protein domain-containing protein [Streptococcus loxodontisalivarius]MBM7643126.1 hypothetical protein [Streptococcus loxodontisalivarius]
MFRDKYRNEDYFEKRLQFNVKTFYEFEELKKDVLEERLSYFYLSQLGYSNKLLTISYSLGKSPDDIFKWFKISLHYFELFYETYGSTYDLIDYFSLAVLFEDRKEEFIEDIEKVFQKYMTFVDAGDQLQDDFIDFLGVYLLQGDVVNFHSHLEYLNLMGDTVESVIEAQKFWYYAHSEAFWYNSHLRDTESYYGYWSFDTAALCKIRGIYDERFKDMDFFPYDLLVQEE